MHAPQSLRRLMQETLALQHQGRAQCLTFSSTDKNPHAAKSAVAS